MLFLLQMRDQLCGVIDQRARTSVTIATQWLSDTTVKVDWCLSLDDGIDHEGVETRRAVIADLCSAWADGESRRVNTLKQITVAARAASESEQAIWMQQGEELHNKWSDLALKLQDTR